MAKFEVWTDGACKGNPGPGGYGYVIRKTSEPFVEDAAGFGSEKNTTNNRMELRAAIAALKHLEVFYPGEKEVILHSDSKYVINGITSWIKNWKTNGWKSGKNPVKNRDLWEKLDYRASKAKVSWVWVKGHSGNADNERVDKLANIAINMLKE
jgi:ribonuclease HI